MSSRDFVTFREFTNAADFADSGDAAARAHLGYPVSHLAEAVLGEGPWTPDPERWGKGNRARAVLTDVRYPLHMMFYGGSYE